MDCRSNTRSSRNPAGFLLWKFAKNRKRLPGSSSTSRREQFKRLGVFGDWENPYLTMDPKYEAEILRAFAVFVEEGLVYQSKKPVFWSTGAQTALAEAEVEYQDRDDTAVYVRFPLSPDQVAKISLQTDKPVSVGIWTTTPWTLPANLAIAVDPNAEYEILGNPLTSRSDYRSQVARTIHPTNRFCCRGRINFSCWQTTGRASGATSISRSKINHIRS